MKYYSIGVTNSNYAAPIAAYLQNELGWVGLDAYVTDTLNDGQKGALAAAFEDIGAEMIFETDTSRIARAISRRHPENRGRRYFDDITPLYIVGSSLEKQLAASRGAASLAVSFPVYNRLITDRSYAGFRGGLHLFEDLLSSIFSGR
jgi:nitrogenase molybdenum-iron protein beta chain